MAKLTSETLWGGIQSIGSEDAAPSKLSPAVIAKLVASGSPQLTAKGSKAYTVSESGDGEVPELDDYGR